MVHDVSADEFEELRRVDHEYRVENIHEESERLKQVSDALANSNVKPLTPDLLLLIYQNLSASCHLPLSFLIYYTLSHTFSSPSHSRS